MDQRIKSFAEDHIDELKKDIKDLCAIPSVLSDPAPQAPFGEECRRALRFGGKLCERYGFKTTDYDNYVIAADFDQDLPRYLDILGHTDVVPAGEGWSVTEPFKVIEKDGRLYGRGTSDDKGPLLCALYAMRAIKESAIPLKRGVRIIMGSDEETGSIDIGKYYEKEEEAECTFSPDAEFPLINIEKGMFRGDLSACASCEGEGVELVSMTAGVATNAVPNRARAEFLGTSRQMLASALEKLKEKVPVDYQIYDDREIMIIGESAHASTPEKGVNAGLALLMLLSYLPMADNRRNSLLGMVPKLFPYGVYDGRGIGIDMTDREGLSLTATLDLFKVDEKGMSFTFDSRVPLCATEDNCLLTARRYIEEAGFTFECPGMIPVHYVPGDSDFVKKLLNAYQDVTGLTGRAIGIGGGTYVHDLKNGVAFGAVLPGIDTRMHGADEFMPVDNLITAVEVYAQAIIDICG